VIARIPYRRFEATVAFAWLPAWASDAISILQLVVLQLVVLQLAVGAVVYHDSWDISAFIYTMRLEINLFAIVA